MTITLAKEREMPASEVIRAQVVKELMQVGTVQKCWPTWQAAIRRKAGVNPTAASALKLGEQLTEIFQTTAQKGRGQADVSGGGAGWESLICWYLNLCLIGTRAVVIKKRNTVPKSIRQALTVSYNNVATNSESDLVAVILPDAGLLNALGGALTAQNRTAIDNYVDGHMGDTEVLVIQCKTNWNDNAQVPMLWDMIYSKKTFSHIVLGLHGHTIHTLKHFAYAFATLPSNQNTKFTPTSMPVGRVRSLSGGNYWGKPPANGVAASLEQIFAKNFSSATDHLGTPWRNHLDNELRLLGTSYSYFEY